jgi:hypothetical protein
VKVTTPRRLKRLGIRADMLLYLLRALDGKRRLRCEGLPADARVAGIVTDRVFDTVELWLESDEFPPLEEHSITPDLRLTFHDVAALPEGWAVQP